MGDLWCLYTNACLALPVGCSQDIISLALPGFCLWTEHPVKDRERGREFQGLVIRAVCVFGNEECLEKLLRTKRLNMMQPNERRCLVPVDCGAITSSVGGFSLDLCKKKVLFKPSLVFCYSLMQSQMMNQVNNNTKIIITSIY